MKKLALLPVLTALTILLTLYSCKKDEDTIEPVVEEVTPTPTPTPTTSNINSFFTDNTNDAKQTFTIDAGISQSISGAGGTYIYIPANTFQNNSGNIVSGNITVELIEVQTQSDMIWMNKTTTSNGQLLVSGGELSVKAFQNGEQLVLAPSGSINVQMPTNNPTNMSLFSGTEDVNGNLNWTPTTFPANVDSSGGFVFTIYSGTFGNDSLGWINCDYFYGQQNLTTLSVNTPANHDSINTGVFLFFHNIYSVAPTSWNIADGNFQSYQNSLPIGEQITIVAISEINGQLYSSFTPITLTANHSESITFSTTTIAALQIDLDNL